MINYAFTQILLACFLSWAISQGIKAFTFFMNNENFNLKNICIVFVWSSGGMPSSHSAVVSALTTAVAFKEGVESTLFVITLFLAIIVIRDSMGVRKAAGDQAVSLNKLNDVISLNFNQSVSKVKVISGHTPLEAGAGCFLGFLTSVIINLI